MTLTSDPQWQPVKPKRRGRLLIGVGTAAVVLAAAALIGYSQDWGKDSGPSSPAAAPSAPVGSGGGLGGEVTAEPDSGPESADDVDWKGLRYDTFHGTQVPVSPRYGPKTVDAATASGYTHDSGGAIVAAVQLGVRVSAQAGPDTYAPTVERQVTGDTTTLLAQLDADHQEARESSGLPESEPLRIYTQVIGYAPLSSPATGPETTVRLLIRGPGGDGGTVMGEIPLTLQWDTASADWKMVAPASGEWTFQAVSTTAGYRLLPGLVS
ncbi:hypothetical protein [Streptomyces parvus]|uniref:hypothetical protein n=1 Tax=Streptomyces parvus TaxID=66428 RepID=UPI0036AEFA66